MNNLSFIYLNIRPYGHVKYLNICLSRLLLTTKYISRSPHKEQVRFFERASIIGRNATPELPRGLFRGPVEDLIPVHAQDELGQAGAGGAGRVHKKEGDAHDYDSSQVRISFYIWRLRNIWTSYQTALASSLPSLQFVQLFTRLINFFQGCQ